MITTLPKKEICPIQAQMIFDIQRRREIFRTNPKDPAYDEPIKKLTREYGKGFIWFVRDLFTLWKIRIVNLN